MSEPFPELDDEWDYKGDDPAWQLLYRWHKSGRAGSPLTKIMMSSSDTGLHELARRINAMLVAREAAGHAAAVAKLREPSEAMVRLATDAVWECDQQSAWDCIARDDCWKAAKAALRAAADALEAELRTQNR